MAAETVQYIFDNTVTTRDITKFTLMRGVTDFTALQQYDLYETGYSFLICLQIPKFMERLKEKNEKGYGTLIDNYKHIIEYDFRGAQGIEDITSETSNLTNGIDELQMITRVREQSGSQFTMNYFERSGSVLTKFNEAFLRGIKDPRTQFKRYCGLLTGSTTADIGSEDNTNTDSIDKGFHNEIFHFLLIVADNSGFNVEKAYILASCQPSAANTSIYNVTKGEIGFSELSIAFNGFPISGRIVNQRGAEFLKWINDHTCFDEMEFGYQILSPENKNGIMTEGNILTSPTIDNFDPNGAFSTTAG